MLIDCRDCPMRQVQCDDCVVTALLAIPVPDRQSAPVPDRQSADPNRHSVHPDGSRVAVELGPFDPRDDERDRQAVLPEQPLDLDWRERAAVTRLVRAGLVSPAVAASARARREPLPLSLRSATG